jgi:3-hydroxybutyryl-CoA dehydrogenase
MSSGGLSSSNLVAVVDSGTAGAGTAHVAAAAGRPVMLHDARTDAAPAPIPGDRQDFQKLATQGRISGESAEGASLRLRAASNLEQPRDAGIVIEAVVEDPDAKRQLFAELEGLVAVNCIFATNASSLSISAIAAHSTWVLPPANPCSMPILAMLGSGLPSTGNGSCRIRREKGRAWIL